MNCVRRFHFNSFFEDTSKATAGVLRAALRSTVAGHGGPKHFSVHIQWNHPQRVKPDNSAYPSKNSPVLGEECERDLPNCDNEGSALIPTYPNRSFQTRCSYSTCTKNIPCSYCIHNYKDFLFTEIITTKIRYSYATHNYNYSESTLFYKVTLFMPYS